VRLTITSRELLTLVTVTLLIPILDILRSPPQAIAQQQLRTLILLSRLPALLTLLLPSPLAQAFEDVEAIGESMYEVGHAIRHIACTTLCRLVRHGKKSVKTNEEESNKVKIDCARK
jgi:hypothetical protein